MLLETQRIILTRANLRNNYIRLRQFNGLIPEDILNSGGEIVLEFERVGEVRTNIDREKGILANRKAVKRFFEVNQLKASDEIAVERIGERKFKVAANSKGEVAASLAVSDREADVREAKPGKDQLLLFGSKKAGKCGKGAVARGRLVHANDLDGKEWTSYSISIWKDIRKAGREKELEHPAMFPVMLVERIIRCFTRPSEKMILDPFMGSGSTLVGACILGRTGIGLEVYSDYVQLAQQRLAFYMGRKEDEGSYLIYPHDARKMGEFIEEDSIDLCFTSPPYWNILSQKRTADNKQIRDYGDSEVDLGRIDDYSEFLRALGEVFYEVYKVLKPGKYCVVNVMDLRKGNRFYPFHADLAKQMERIGYVFDDMIIWDRSHEYNNLRPLGYPTVFRINKVHEYLLIFQKPKLKEGKKRGRRDT